MSESHQEQLQKIKAKYPKAYVPWSAADDELLKTSYAGGMSIDTFAKTLQRQPSAIRSRLQKLGVLKIELTDHTEKPESLAEFLPIFMKHTLSSEYLADRAARQERQALYANVLSLQAIGQTLAESGAQVDVLPMQEVKDLAPYQAVVAGSAIRGGKWLPEAMQFMQTHQAALAQKPFAAFLVCMTLAMPSADKYREHVATWLEPVRALVKPVSEGLFAGILDIRQVSSFGDRLKFRLSVAFGVWSEGDHRDWNAIRAWAESLRPLLLRPVQDSSLLSAWRT